MDLTIHDFFLSDIDIQKIYNWINSFNNDDKKPPLFISGYIGCGKSTLVDIILKDYTSINVNNNLLTVNTNEYINDCLNKKDISMMFKKTYYKSIVFDNILPSDKNIIKELKFIIDTLDKYTHNPIIITSDNYINKNINTIRSKCICIDIKYTDKDMKNILDKIFKREITLKCKKDIIKNNRNNILHIISNKHLYINNEVNYMDSNNIDILMLTEDLKTDISLNDMFIKYSLEYNIIGLNILDNIYNNYSEDNVNIIVNIYKSLCLYDNHQFYSNKNLIFNVNNISVLLSIIKPYTLLKKNNILHENIKYNTYISKSLIYTHHNILYIHCNYQYNYYDLIIRLIHKIKDKHSEEKIRYIYKKYECNKKILNYYIKLSNIIYDKEIKINIIKQVNNIIKYE